MVKKNPENKFRKLILTWWVWIIIAVVSYSLIYLTPIQSKVGTFLFYLSQISWVIVVVLLIVSGIKRIQKSKMKDYWKVSLTILGILLIFGYIFFAFQDIELFHPTKFLTDQNYEVLDYGYNEISKESPNYDPDSVIRDFAYVEMKALGNREDQVSDGWIFLGNKYKDASEYTTIILTENEECRYSVDGGIYRAHLFALSNYWSTDNPILMNKTDIKEKFDYISWVGFLKTELTKLANGEETEYSSYEIGKMLDEYEKLNNTQIDRETIYQIYTYYLNEGYCE